MSTPAPVHINTLERSMALALQISFAHVRFPYGDFRHTSALEALFTILQSSEEILSLTTSLRTPLRLYRREEEDLLSVDYLSNSCDHDTKISQLPEFSASLHNLFLFI